MYLQQQKELNKVWFDCTIENKLMCLSGLRLAHKDLFYVFLPREFREIMLVVWNLPE